MSSSNEYFREEEDRAEKAVQKAKLLAEKEKAKEKRVEKEELAKKRREVCHSVLLFFADYCSLSLLLLSPPINKTQEQDKIAQAKRERDEAEK